MSEQHVQSPRWDHCATCHYPWPCRESLVDQLAAERTAREAAEQDRDEWECRYGQAERVVEQDSAALAQRDQQLAALNAACRWLFTPWEEGNPNLTQVLTNIRSLIESGDRQQPGDGQ